MDLQWRGTAGLAGNVITLVEGASFCLSGPDGRHRTRVRPWASTSSTPASSRRSCCASMVRRWNSSASRPTTRSRPRSSACSRPRPGRPEGTIAVFRRRSVGDGLVERILLRNYETESRHVTVRLEVPPTSPTCSRSRNAEHLTVHLLQKRCSSTDTASSSAPPEDPHPRRTHVGFSAGRTSSIGPTPRGRSSCRRTANGSCASR